MDLTSILLTAGAAALVTLGCVGLVGWLVLRRMRALLPPQAAPTRVVDLDEAPTLDALSAAPQRCEGCRHWNLDAGQRTMRATPAFFAATAHLEPWQMARPGRVEPDPAYAELEEQMHAASAAGDVERSKALQDQLLALDPGQLVPDERDVDQAMLATDWTQLGACGHHRELRFASDGCEEFAS